MDDFASLTDALAVFNAFHAEDLNDKELKWRKVLDLNQKDGFKLTIHQRPVTGRKVNLVRSVNTYPGIEYDDLAYLARNIDLIRTKDMIKLETVSNHENGMLETFYFESKIPFMQNREGIVHQ